MQVELKVIQKYYLHLCQEEVKMDRTEQRRNKTNSLASLPRSQSEGREDQNGGPTAETINGGNEQGVGV